MKELVTNSKELMEISNRIQKRTGYFITESLKKLEYEFFERGFFTTCVLTYNNEICGIGDTIKSKKDKYNFKIAMNVSFSKAIRDYISYLRIVNVE